MKNEITQTTAKTPMESHETIQGKKIYRPLADIIETSEGISLTLEMPGVAPESVDITLEKKELTIFGKTHSIQPGKLDLTYSEYGQGDYKRTFILSEDFASDRINAEMRNGVLHIQLPKAEEAQPKKIVVNAA